MVSGLDEIGAKLVQCSTDHDAGEQLLGMGGCGSAGPRCEYVQQMVHKVKHLRQEMKGLRWLLIRQQDWSERLLHGCLQNSMGH